ncbi:MAG: hypothetical protein H7Z11_12640 [Verrucomicrobia bacterium]|nr:hypothetical protein [Leptolyngbya sp. ES-bin-22]
MTALGTSGTTAASGGSIGTNSSSYGTNPGATPNQLALGSRKRAIA